MFGLTYNPEGRLSKVGAFAMRAASGRSESCAVLENKSAFQTLARANLKSVAPRNCRSVNVWQVIADFFFLNSQGL